MPKDADKSAQAIREFLENEFDEEIAVIITDTQGRAFRFGAIGTAVGCSGISPIWKRVGEKDLYGRELETTEIATCDELASAASLIMGQADQSSISSFLCREYSVSHLVVPFFRVPGRCHLGRAVL